MTRVEPDSCHLFKMTPDYQRKPLCFKMKCKNEIS